VDPVFAVCRQRVSARLDPLPDQQLGGLVMWAPASVAYFASGLMLAARLLRSSRPAIPDHCRA